MTDETEDPKRKSIEDMTKAEVVDLLMEATEKFTEISLKFAEIMNRKIPEEPVAIRKPKKAPKAKR